QAGSSARSRRTGGRQRIPRRLRRQIEKPWRCPAWPAVRRRVGGSPPTAASNDHMTRRGVSKKRTARPPDPSSADHIRQEAQKTGALDGLREFTLFGGADGGDPRRHDLAALGNVTRQQAGVLRVEGRRGGGGDGGALSAWEEEAAGCWGD